MFHSTQPMISTMRHPPMSPAPVRCDMAFIEPMHRNKPNITYFQLYQSASSSASVVQKPKAWGLQPSVWSSNNGSAY